MKRYLLIIVVTVLGGLLLFSGCSGKKKTRYSNGRLKEEYSMKKDAEGNKVKHGPYIAYWPNKKKREECTYDLGKKDGKYE